MFPIQVELSTVRFFTLQGDVVGAGCLCSERYIVTCSHVIADALGIPSNKEGIPGGSVSLDFPMVAPGKTLTANVVFWRPAQSGWSLSAQHGEDLAVLELQSFPPENTQPARLVVADDLWGHSFRVPGFPIGHNDGVWASGVIRGRRGNGWLQIEDIKETGYSIESGFSGAPVWDEQLKGVVGIAVASEGRRLDTKAAFIISTSLIGKTCSLLKSSVKHLDTRLSQDPEVDILLRYTRLLRNRVEQAPRELLEALNLSFSRGIESFLSSMYVEPDFQTYGSIGIDRERLSIRELINLSKNIAILGNGGTGKTTCIKALVSRLCDEFESSSMEGIDIKEGYEKPFLPILINLSSVSDYLLTLSEGEDGILDLLSYKLSIDFRTIPEIHELVLRRLEFGTLCLIFDEIDQLLEVARERFLSIIKKLSNIYSPAIIITSRKVSYFRRLPDFLKAEIVPLNLDKIDDFLIKWYSNISLFQEDVFERRLFAWSLAKKLKDTGLNQLAATPLSLAQIAALHNKQEDLTLDDSKIIQKLLKLLIFQWRSGLSDSFNRFKKFREEVRISDDELLLITGEIAFRLLYAQTKSQATTVVRGEILETISESLDDLEIRYEQASEIILDFLENCNGILNNTSGFGDYNFYSSQIQKYLCSYYLINVKHSRKSYTEQLCSLLEESFDDWTDVTLYVLKLLQDSAAVMFTNYLFVKLSRLIKNRKEEKINLFLGNLVNDLINRNNELGKDLIPLEAVKEKVYEITTNSNSPWISAVRAAHILGNLSDDRSCINHMLTRDYWVECPSGLLLMGYGSDRHEVYVEKFYIAKYLVTNEQFFTFIEETNYKRVPQNWNQDKPYIYKKNYPVVGLHWKEAVDFAVWLNEKVWLNLTQDILEHNFEVRLPTEAEWEKVALNFKDVQRIYDAIHPSNPSQEYKQFLCDYEVYPIGIECIHDTESIAYDLFSNVWEWTATSYENYPYVSNDGRNDLLVNQPRVVRGGYTFSKDAEFLQTHRGQCHMYRPVYKMNNVGFRLAIGAKLT